MPGIAQDLTELVGQTPLVRLHHISENISAEIVAKLEMMNPGGSVKDRIGLSMILAAEEENLIDKDTTIIEPTSGNTGIALAWVCASKGYKLIIVMPDSMSRERVLLLGAFGTEVILTPAHLGMVGAIQKAEQLASETPRSFMPQQFKNPNNPGAHARTTGEEILRDTHGKLDYLVCGIGTGGTITGVARTLKKSVPKIRIVGVEPQNSAILSGGTPGPHMLQGMGAGFVPDILDRGLIDEVVKVSDDEAVNQAKSLIRKEGILCGISSGAVTAAAVRIAKRKESAGKRIVAILADTGERYLSFTPLWR